MLSRFRVLFLPFKLHVYIRVHTHARTYVCVCVRKVKRGERFKQSILPGPSLKLKEYMRYEFLHGLNVYWYIFVHGKSPGTSTTLIYFLYTILQS